MAAVSVLLAAYNEEKYIKSAIKSICQQTFTDFEFVIINDGSEDNTSEIIKSFGDSRIKLYNKGHTGLADSLNYGLSKCNGELVFRMDAQDISLPQRIMKQYNFLLTNKDYGVISCRYLTFKDNKLLYYACLPETDTEIRKGFLIHSYIVHSGAAFRKDLILSKGGYISDYYEDYELWIRLIEYTKFYNIPEILLLVRYLEDSLSHKDFDLKRKKHYELQSKYNEYLLTNIPYEKRELSERLGWREFFWGSAEEARKLWIENLLWLKPKIMITIIISFLPKSVINKFILSRSKYRIRYYLNYFKFKIFRDLVRHEN